MHNDVAPFRRSVDQRERRPRRWPRREWRAEQSAEHGAVLDQRKKRPHEKLSTCCSIKRGEEAGERERQIANECEIEREIERGKTRLVEMPKTET